jgi:hypothetical protein
MEFCLVKELVGSANRSASSMMLAGEDCEHSQHQLGARKERRGKGVFPGGSKMMVCQILSALTYQGYRTPGGNGSELSLLLVVFFTLSAEG